MSETPEPSTVKPSEKDIAATVLFLGNQQLVIDPETGEVTGEVGAPDVEQQVEEQAVIDYVGARLKRSRARLAGLEAERDALIRQINEHYDPQIKQQRSYLRFLEMRYFPVLRGIAERMKEAVSGKTKTFRVGLLTLSLRKVASKVTIEQEADALTYLKAVCPDAVKVKESILVSQIPDTLDLSSDATGLKREPETERLSVE